MTNRIAETSPLVYARVAGLAYLLVIMLGGKGQYIGKCFI